MRFAAQRREIGTFLAMISCSVGVFLLPQGQDSGAAASDYRTSAVTSGGRLMGRLTTSAGAALSQKVVITKDPEVCGTERALGEDLAPGEALAGTVIYLQDVRAGKAFADSQTASVVQRGCRFVTSGTVNGPNPLLRVKNLDPITHNIQVAEVIGRGYRAMHDVGQHADSPDVELPITLVRGNVVRLTCGIHSFMEDWIFVARNPYYAVADETGTFMIGDIPPGEHRVGIWHPAFGISFHQVVVPPGGSVTFDLELSPE